jgi:hypothetical protein
VIGGRALHLKTGEDLRLFQNPVGAQTSFAMEQPHLMKNPATAQGIFGREEKAAGMAGRDAGCNISLAFCCAKSQSPETAGMAGRDAVSGQRKG